MSVVDRITAQAAADVIKNETTPAANTATRVGQLFRDLADSTAIPAVIATTLSANVNNWAPTDFVKAKDGTLRVTTNDGTQREISGFAAQTHGFRFTLENRGAGGLLILHENTGSSAANRIQASALDGDGYVQPETGSMTFEYDATAQRWYVISFQQMRSDSNPLPVGASAAIGTSHRWADANHVHALPIGTGLNWNGSNLEAKTEPAPTLSATLATADATITNAITIALADNTRYDVKARITGRADTNALILQEVSVRYSRKSGGAPVQSGTPDVPSTNSVGVGVGYVIDVSGNDLRIRVQGAAATDINWAVEAWLASKALPAQPA